MSFIPNHKLHTKSQSKVLFYITSTVYTISHPRLKVTGPCTNVLVWCQQVVEVPDAFPSRSFTEQFFWHITGCILLHQHTHWHNFVHMVNVGTAFLHSHFGPPKLHNALLQLLFCPRGFPGNTSLQLVPHHFDGVKVRTLWKEKNYW